MKTITLNQIGWKIIGSVELKTSQSTEPMFVKLSPEVVYLTEPMTPAFILSKLTTGQFRYLYNIESVKTARIKIYTVYEKNFEDYETQFTFSGKELEEQIKHN